MTQHEQIIDYIRSFGSISPMEAFMDLGITKLATRVSEMIRNGVAFIKEPVVSKNRYGRPVTFMRYRLDESRDKHEAPLSE